MVRLGFMASAVTGSVPVRMLLRALRLARSQKLTWPSEQAVPKTVADLRAMALTACRLSEAALKVNGLGYFQS